jgi:arginyl-tRNA synthetase
VKLADFKQIVEDAYKNMNPAIIAKYSYELSQIFNEFYHACPVIGSEEKQQFRTSLVESFRTVLKNSLSLLGIDVLEEM